MSAETKKIIGAVILGAGYSRRFGAADKRLQRLPGQKTTIAEVTAGLYTGVFDAVRIVLREEDEKLCALLEGQAQIVISDHAHLGMGHSLAAGFSGIDWDWAFIGLLDMPYISSDTLKQLKDSATNSQQAIIRPVLDLTSEGLQNGDEFPYSGHPVGIRSELFEAVRACSGDNGARAVLAAHQDQIEDFNCTDLGIVRDIDTPADLRR